MQKQRINSKASMNLSSYDLFIGSKEKVTSDKSYRYPIGYSGIECAMFPHLYPSSDFTDTALEHNYMEYTYDETNRVLSIGYSWTRKVLSSVRVYGEQRDLAFFLYEKQMALKFFAAHERAKRMEITADIMTRDSQASAGYWEIVRDSLADLVRIMVVRSYDEDNYPELYRHCRNLRGEMWQCAFPNIFITVAPAEWKFGRPFHL